jgi:hypothetical protein
MSNVCVNALPTKIIDSLIFHKCTGNIPNLIGTEEVSLSQSSLTIYSETVHRLSVLYESCYCDKLPNFPNLTHLQVTCEYLFNMDCVLEKYPNLEDLYIYCLDVNFIGALKLFQHKLTISSFELEDITCFSMLQCSELDLSNCPYIQDYSAVGHIPIVRKSAKTIF